MLVLIEIVGPLQFFVVFLGFVGAVCKIRQIAALICAPAHMDAHTAFLCPVMTLTIYLKIKYDVLLNIPLLFVYIKEQLYG